MPEPLVLVTDARGDPIGGAVVTIEGKGKDFLCPPIDAGIGEYDCGGPKLGGYYAVRAHKAGFESGLEIVLFDDACDGEQFRIEVALSPELPGEGLDAGSDSASDAGSDAGLDARSDAHDG